jgi:hypothetical protein
MTSILWPATPPCHCWRQSTSWLVHVAGQSGRPHRQWHRTARAKLFDGFDCR